VPYKKEPEGGALRRHNEKGQSSVSPKRKNTHYSRARMFWRRDPLPLIKRIRNSPFQKKSRCACRGKGQEKGDGTAEKEKKSKELSRNVSSAWVEIVERQLEGKEEESQRKRERSDGSKNLGKYPGQKREERFAIVNAALPSQNLAQMNEDAAQRKKVASISSKKSVLLRREKQTSARR